MDNLLAGIRISSFNEKSQDTLVIPRQLSLSATHFRGGRLPPESVAGLNRNTQLFCMTTIG
jgi:hypothetical protein